jgi:hypothetical protein
MDQASNITKIQLKPEILDQLARLDLAISQHSVEHAQIIIRAQALLAELDGFYESKKSTVLAAAKESGLNPDMVVQMKINQDGSAIVQMKIPQSEQVSSDPPVIQ